MSFSFSFRVPTSVEIGIGCTICGIKQEKTHLTKEHVVPLSLGGEFVIRNSTCKPCQNNTSKFERIIARRLFLNHRSAFVLKSRRKNSIPVKVPIDIVMFGILIGIPKRIYLDAKDAPILVAVPGWGTAPILTGVSAKQKDFRSKSISVTKPDYAKMERIKRRYLAETVYSAVSIVEAEPLAKLVNKVAICFAKYYFGVRAKYFGAKLLNSTKNQELFPYFIGSCGSNFFEEENDIRCFSLNVGQKSYIGVAWKIFPHFFDGGFYCIVGELIDASDKSVEHVSLSQLQKVGYPVDLKSQMLRTPIQFFSGPTA